jgi:hypothetical protein
MKGFLESLTALDAMAFDLFCLSPIIHDASHRVMEYDCIMRRA